MSVSPVTSSPPPAAPDVTAAAAQAAAPTPAPAPQPAPAFTVPEIISAFDTSA